ncbi:MAG: glycosyltransferase family 1 protein [Magnetococcales bacterium]|nr:glycosyltransferase family 1 protein [Magnetococcales bacterium]
MTSPKSIGKIGYDFLYPIYRTQQQLRSLGFDNGFFYGTDQPDRLLECDLLAVHSHSYRYHQNDPEAVDKLKGIMQRAKRCWFFDVTDSAGTFYPDFRELCQVYLKKQLYADRTQYTLPGQLDSRQHLDYYIKRDRLENQNLDFSHLPQAFFDRVRLSWNVGVGDYRTILSPSHFLNDYAQRLQTGWLRERSLPGMKNRYTFPPFRTRDRDVIACYSGYQKRNAPIATHRGESTQAAESLRGHRRIVSGFLKPAVYFAALDQVRCGLSPFGWGEITYKDLEMFQRGIALLKPDISFLDSWPDYFIPRQTYLSYRWDAADLPELLERVLEDPPLLEGIAREGQERLRAFDVCHAPGVFLDRFRDIFSAPDTPDPAPPEKKLREFPGDYGKKRGQD